MLETSRLRLRPFLDSDAADLYDYARDPRVGPIAGWPVHKNVGESLKIIRTVFSAPGTFAMERKDTGRVIGSVGFVDRHPKGMDPACPDDEIGYALHPKDWGHGYTPEAVEAVLRWGFETLGLARIWCGHYEGNTKSQRVIQKCGFQYAFTMTEYVELMGETRIVHHYVQTKEAWHERISRAV